MRALQALGDAALGILSGALRDGNKDLALSLLN